MEKAIETLTPVEKSQVQGYLGVPDAVSAGISQVVDMVSQKPDAEDVAAAINSKFSEIDVDAYMASAAGQTRIQQYLSALLSSLDGSPTLTELIAALNGEAPADTTAPTITSGTSGSVAENQTLLYLLTSDDASATWSIVGGADAAQFELSTLTPALRWVGNGSKDYEAPADADGNNTYVVQVKATDIYGNASAAQTITITVTNVTESGSPVAGLAYSRAEVPSWTRRATKASLLTDLGLSASDVIDASDYANFEAAIDAANAALKPLVAGIDNGQYTATTTRTRVSLDVSMYAYGNAHARITAATRLEGWLCLNRFKVTIRGFDFKDFTQVVMIAGGTLPLARPDDSGYSAATTAAARAPYHTSNDKLVLAHHAAVDAGFLMQGCGHFTVSGSPTITSIQPVRQRKDGGPGGTRSAYAYSVNDNYDSTTTTGQNAWAAALETGSPNLLTAAVTSATAASLAAAINSNTANSGFSAAVEPVTGKVVICSTAYDNRPLDWTVASSGGTVTYDTIGPDIDVSYCKVNGCDRLISGISDVTSIGLVTACKNVGRATWGILSLMTLRYRGFIVCNNDWQDCLKNGGSYGTVGLRSNGNSMPAGSNQNQNNSIVFAGSNRVFLMRYTKATGVIALFDNNLIMDIEGVGNTDTVNSCVAVDARNIWDISGNRRDNTSFSYNYIRNFKNLSGAIDCNVLYFKGDSYTIVGNDIVGFGAARVSSYRPKISAGSEAGGFLGKNNGNEYDTAAEVYMANNYLAGGPNGIAWLKWEDKGGKVTIINNRLSGWTNQLDDATLGTATGRTATIVSGSATSSGTAFTVSSISAGALAVGMTVTFGAGSAVIKSGSGTAWTLDRSLSGSGAFTADYYNIVDGALIRGYSRTGAVTIRSNKFEDVAHQSRPYVVLHAVTRSGTSVFADWELSNNIAQNAGSAAYPAYTTDNAAMLINSTISGAGSFSGVKLGRNKTKNAGGSDVGNWVVTYGGSPYTDNSNTTSQPYVAVP